LYEQLTANKFIAFQPLNCLLCVNKLESLPTLVNGCQSDCWNGCNQWTVYVIFY